jgi:L-ascorbate metabolism protein UlaG (beta-lactamase superfamily)
MRPEQDELTWLGQAGFRLRHGGVVVLIDPFFSEHEASTPTPVLSFVADADWVWSRTRGPPRHQVHRPNRRRAARRQRGASRADRRHGRRHRAGGTDPRGGARSFLVAGALEVEVVPAVHGVTIGDGYSDGSGHDGRVRFVGYVVRTRTAPTTTPATRS